jgi:hypothetical protein
MKAALTQARFLKDRRNLVQYGSKSIVYVKSPLDDTADRFATTHGVYHLPFKSKVWSRICRQANKANLEAIRPLFPQAESLKFSAKAGCRCGCSPGFIMKHKVGPQQNFWVDIEVYESELEAFATSINCARNHVDLRKEIEKNGLDQVLLS